MDSIMIEPDRRAVIADAAIRLLGAEGARGLTHRSVDREAGLPDGSTSYYCRRRADLLALALVRHIELERRELARYAKAFKHRMPLNTLARTIAGQMARWVSENELLLTVRFELFLAASRDAELRAIVNRNRSAFEDTIQTALATAGAAAPRVAARALIGLMEGILLDTLRTGSPSLKTTELSNIIRSLLGAARAKRASEV
jgi:DNA-binding transcriptional regulator YbjK